MIFGGFADNLQALEDVDYIVDSSSFHAERYGDFVELEGDLTPAFEVVYEFPAEFLKAFFLAVIGEDLLFDHFLLKLFMRGAVAVLLHEEEVFSCEEEVLDEGAADVC